MMEVNCFIGKIIRFVADPLVRETDRLGNLLLRVMVKSGIMHINTINNRA